ncbi:MAG: quinolinate synthase NadA [Alphaproteobacteria bacterium]
MIFDRDRATHAPFDRPTGAPTSPLTADQRKARAAELLKHAEDGQIGRIEALKKQHNAVIMAHNYQTPDIYHVVSDMVGDSLALAQEATTCDADVIVLAGVHFMAETAKLLNPDKTVLIPDMNAGCSLAESITPEDIRKLRAAHPGAPVVTYVNTSAAVKAESDVCCTSGNAVKIVEALGVDKVIFLPDEYLASYVAEQTDVEIITWAGHCEVHELFTPEQIDEYRSGFDGLSVVAHPECPPDVQHAADFVGSTAQMLDYVRREKPKDVFLVTECSMSDNIAAELPEVNFVRPCNMCPHMKLITLDKIEQALTSLQPAIELDPTTAAKARRAIERMLELS